MNCSETNTPEAIHKYYLFASGNEAAFSWLVAKFQPTLANAAWYYVRDHYAVSVVLQEVYLKAWEFRHRITSYCHLFRFMRMNVKWYCITWLKTCRRNAIRFNDGVSSLLENYLLHATNPFEESGRESFKEKWEKIRNAMQCLPQQKQTIMELRFYDGLPMSKIAKRLQLPVTHVRQEVKETVNWLKQAIHSPNVWMATSSAQETQTIETGDAVMDKVFALRKHHKRSFSDIAQQLNLPQSVVLQHYLAVNRLATNSKN